MSSIVAAFLGQKKRKKKVKYFSCLFRLRKEKERKKLSISPAFLGQKKKEKS